MKRLLLLALAALLLCACQPTPETEFVVNKGDQSAMIDMARGEGVDTVTVAGGTEGNATQTYDLHMIYGIPERLQMETESTDGAIKISIDAPILIPEEPMPIVRVKAGRFDQRLAAQLWNALVKDETMYCITDEGQHKRTKSEIAAEIQDLVDWLDGKNDDQQYATESETREAIAALQEQYRNAPDDPERDEKIPCDGTLYTITVSMDGTDATATRTGIMAGNDAEDPRKSVTFHLQNDTDNEEAIVVDYGHGEWGVIPVDKNASMSYSRWSDAMSCGHTLGNLSIELSRSDPLPEETARFIGTTPAEAVEMTEAFLREAGLSDEFGVTQITLWDDRSPANHKPEPSQYAYQVLCMRKVNDILCCSTRNIWQSGEDLFARTYVPTWAYEYITVGIDDEGIFSVWWKGKLTVLDTLMDAATLLPFERIGEIIKTRLPVQYPHPTWESDGGNGCVVSVDRIELGLWRVLEQNELGRGLLVPTYCLYGTAQRREKDGSLRDPEDYTLLYVINAVDGSVIDPAKGY